MTVLTDASEQLDSEGGEDEEEQKEKKPKVADFWQCLHHGVEESSNRLSHLEQFQY